MLLIHSLQSWLPAAVPLLFLLGALAAGLPKTAWSWRVSLLTSAAALAVSLEVALLALVQPATPVSPWLSQTPLSLVMVTLISFMGFLIVRYSRHYLHGDSGGQRYQFWLQFTLASVAVVVLSNHLLVLLAAWVLIGIGLHQLLMFYPDRPRAALAAHKKFLLARLAELTLLAAIVLLYQAQQTFWIDEILAAYRSGQALDGYSQMAALLLAVTALLKCAQLPLHGWLMQVMEAPTPVSALLHAGIINLGGFLLILMAPLMVQATAAQWLLLLVAGTTALLASLIMMTRISIKVMLAWSTCAQMGFMLVECALGLYELALLHLVAHSCYKAHAFLNSGTAVEQSLQSRLADPVRRAGGGRWLLGLLLAVALVVAGFGSETVFSVTGLSMVLPLLLALVILLSECGPVWRVLLPAAGLLGLYGLQKTLFAGLVPTAAHGDLLASVWVSLLLLTLAGSYLLLRYRPHAPLARRLYIHLFAGFYLDEWVTRLTLRLWPARLPQRARPVQPTSTFTLTAGETA